MKKFLSTLLMCSGIWIQAQNYIDNYLLPGLTYTVIASSSNSVALPTDLDFKPNTNELWLALRGNTVGANVIIYNAGLPNQSIQYRKDSNNGHFMPMCMAIAFSDIGDWASIHDDGYVSIDGVQGPSLWSGDTAIHARVFQNSNYLFGSHISMLHQSSWSMGIAHDSAKVYWVFDGDHGNLARYDFVTDHGPGYNDHSQGTIYRYSFVNVTKVPNVPSHMVVDKANNWLYFTDGTGKTLKRLKTTSGTVVGSLSPSNEVLAGYYSVAGASVQTIETFTSQPCGIDYFNDRLVLTDYNTGEITIYNTNAGPNLVKLGVINTGQPGIMGVKIGSDGKIWYVNNTLNTVVRIDPSNSANDAGILNIVSPSMSNYGTQFYSPQFNVCGTGVWPIVTLINNGTNNLTSVNINYKVDNGPITTYTWTGNLAPNASATVAIGNVNVSSGPHSFTVYTSLPNSVSDVNPANDAKQGSFRIINTVPYTFSEGFGSTVFPPVGWDEVGFNRYTYFQRIANYGGFGSNTGCALLNNYLVTNAQPKNRQVDYLILPQIDLTNAPSPSSLNFSYAFARTSFTNPDRLILRASTDCGNTWTTILSRTGSLFETDVPVQNSPFLPLASSWKLESVDLSAYIGQPTIFMFIIENGGGNNFFLDDVNIGSSVFVKQNKITHHVFVYPNPSSGKITLNGVELGSSITVFNLLGQEVLTSKNKSESTEIDLSEYPNDVYYISIDTASSSVVKKIVISK
jgi:hypothetical protein